VPGGNFESLLDDEFGGLDDGVGVGVVVIVENGGGGEGAEAEAGFEGEREFGATGAGPEVDDEAVGEDVVLVELPSGGFHGLFEGAAVDFGAGREADFGEKHAVAAEADAFGDDVALDGVADVGGEFVEVDGEAEGVGSGWLLMKIAANGGVGPGDVVVGEDLNGGVGGAGGAADFDVVRTRWDELREVDADGGAENIGRGKFDGSGLLAVDEDDGF
jgi:hypothetical protein